MTPGRSGERAQFAASLHGMLADAGVPAAARSTDAARGAARAALQVHGAIGYTEELDLHLWLLKVRALAGAWGSQAEHRARVMAAISAPAESAGAGRKPAAETPASRQPAARQPIAGQPTAGQAAAGEPAWS